MPLPTDSVAETAAPATPALRHALKPRQLMMMGLGTAIGAGLFLGSGVGIHAAGPAVLISYLIAGALVIIVMNALGEMAAAKPASGAFSVYAADAMGPTAGATVGWLWWFQIVVVIAAEAVGAAGLLATVWPALPVPLLSLLFMATFTAINLLGVRNFGEFEFWFAILKVLAIVVFLLIGVALLAGWLPGVASPGLSNFTQNGGFAPKGLAGIGSALLVVVFAFGGTEIVAVAAAETADPGRSLARTIRTRGLAHPGVLHRVDQRDRGGGAVDQRRAQLAVCGRAGGGSHSRCRHGDHPGGGGRTAVGAQRQSVRRFADDLLAGPARRSAAVAGQDQRRAGAAGGGDRQRVVRLRRRSVGVVVSEQGVANAAQHRRRHLPAGVDDLAGVATDLARPRGPCRPCAAVPHARLSVSDRAGAGHPGRDLRVVGLFGRYARAIPLDGRADRSHRSGQRNRATRARADVSDGGRGWVLMRCVR
ncbi:membrane hypothetical protein [Xanthomonas citri pv. bilvae]|nr:membrane hypothetical protein [Xanthomonas citri pv. bilvae]